MDEELKQEIIRLRRAGYSRRQIRAELEVCGEREISEAVRGVPPAAWTRRPTARDDLRQSARSLRSQGMLYRDIARELGVSLSSVSLWVRDLPNPARPHTAADVAAHMAMMRRARWDRELARREEERQTQIGAAADAVELDYSARMAVGALVYWAEGAKSKPWRRSEYVAFINSDPLLIRLFLGFLREAPVEYGVIKYRLSIHETADVPAATNFWADVVGVPAQQFLRPTLKRHRPVTVRRNTGESYHGCLVVSVTKSARLYRYIEGTVRGAVAACGAAGDQASLAQLPIPDGLTAGRRPLTP